MSAEITKEEQKIFSAILNDNKFLKTLCLFFMRSLSPKSALIYHAMIRLLFKGQEINKDTLKEELKRVGADGEIWYAAGITEAELEMFNGKNNSRTDFFDAVAFFVNEDEDMRRTRIL